MSNQTMTKAKPQIHSLQVFRGLAALAVVAHHAVLSTKAFIGKVLDTLSHGLLRCVGNGASGTW